MRRPRQRSTPSTSGDRIVFKFGNVWSADTGELVTLELLPDHAKLQLADLVDEFGVELIVATAPKMPAWRAQQLAQPARKRGRPKKDENLIRAWARRRELADAAFEIDRMIAENKRARKTPYAYHAYRDFQDEWRKRQEYMQQHGAPKKPLISLNTIKKQHVEGHRHFPEFYPELAAARKRIK
jgi:hypothetical protein